MEEIRSISFAGAYDIRLEIANAAVSDRFILKDVDGLGPPDVDVAVSNGLYQGRSTGDREIEVMVGLNPDYSIGERPKDLRNELYGLLTPSADYDYVDVTLQGQNEQYRTRAWAKRVSPVPMSRDPQVQITMPCLRSYFTGNIVDINTSTLNKAFFTINNKGSASAGFDMTISFTQALSYFKMTNSWGDRKMQFNYAFQTGDQLRIITTEEDRQAVRYRGGVPLEISGTLTADSIWMMLGGRETAFAIEASSSVNIVTLNYVPRYWGI